MNENTPDNANFSPLPHSDPTPIRLKNGRFARGNKVAVGVNTGRLAWSMAQLNEAFRTCANPSTMPELYEIALNIARRASCNRERMEAVKFLAHYLMGKPVEIQIHAQASLPNTLNFDALTPQEADTLKALLLKTAASVPQIPNP